MDRYIRAARTAETATPRQPKQSQTIIITIPIKNYALYAISQMKVRLYNVRRVLIRRRQTANTANTSEYTTNAARETALIMLEIYVKYTE
jgi:hypothetical protein